MWHVWLSVIIDHILLECTLTTAGMSSKCCIAKASHATGYQQGKHEVRKLQTIHGFHVRDGSVHTVKSGLSDTDMQNFCLSSSPH